jgi:hypothetical protein
MFFAVADLIVAATFLPAGRKVILGNVAARLTLNGTGSHRFLPGVDTVTDACPRQFGTARPGLGSVADPAVKQADIS